MKLKVDYWSFYGANAGFYVFKNNWLWGWEHYDNLRFETREAAIKHARDIKELAA